MAKFLRIGVHHSNVSGYTSKAWSVRRVGSTVLLKWGAVEVRGAGYGRRIYWASPPRQKTVSCDTEKRARDYVKNAISRRVGHQYERLLENVPIRGRRPADHNVELNRMLATMLFVDMPSSHHLSGRWSGSMVTHISKPAKTEQMAMNISAWSWTVE
jgi:hypothetical protein